jgi:hypothetical protein
MTAKGENCLRPVNYLTVLAHRRSQGVPQPHILRIDSLNHRSAHPAGKDLLALLSAPEFSLRTQKSPPRPEFRNPTDLVNQLAFFTSVLAFVPHCLIYGFPIRVESWGKCRNGKSFCMVSAYGHLYNPLVPGLTRVSSTLRASFAGLRCIPASIQGFF